MGEGMKTKLVNHRVIVALDDRRAPADPHVAWRWRDGIRRKVDALLMAADVEFQRTDDAADVVCGHCGHAQEIDKDGPQCCRAAGDEWDAEKAGKQ